MAKTKYTQRFDGEGFEIPNRTIYKLACCDCGLVHRIVLAAPGVKKGIGIGFASVRDNRATAQLRRRKSQNVPALAQSGGEKTKPKESNS